MNVFRYQGYLALQTPLIGYRCYLGILGSNDSDMQKHARPSLQGIGLKESRPCSLMVGIM